MDMVPSTAPLQSQPTFQVEPEAPETVLMVQSKSSVASTRHFLTFQLFESAKEAIVLKDGPGVGNGDARVGAI